MRAHGSVPSVMSYEALAGDPVVNRRDEDLGTIADVVIDVLSGRVAYAVLARGGVLGLGERLHAVPWTALALDAERACFVLDVDAESLDALPGFDPARLPDAADPAWERSAQGLREALANASAAAEKRPFP